MNIIKGLFLGSGLLVIFTGIYFWANGVFGADGAVTRSVLEDLTVRSPYYWSAIGLFLALGIVIFAMWPVKVN